MTRARRELVLSFHGAASPWIADVSESIGSALWAEFEVLNPTHIVGVPEPLPEIEAHSGIHDVYNLIGDQFVYTSYAVGISLEAQQKLIELVDGRGLVRSGSGRRVKWANVGSLMRDVRQTRKHDTLIGPSVAAELRALAAPVEQP